MRWLSWCKQQVLLVIGMAIGVNGVVVAVAPGRMEATYGVPDGDPDVAVLIRHRAVMLMVIGATLAAAAFRRRLRPVAIPSAAVTMVTFAVFALTTEVNDQQMRVAVADLVLLILLGTAAAVPDGTGLGQERGDRVS